MTKQVDLNARGIARIERDLADLRKEVSDLRRLIAHLTEKAS